MKIRYQVETYEQGVWLPAYCAMADSYSAMALRLDGEAGSSRLKTQYAVLTSEDERRMPKEYIVKDAGFNPAYNMHFEGMVTVNTESGTALVPYLRGEADCYRTGADDKALCTKPLEILRELEAYRMKQAGKNNPSDFVIRVCEAIVARAGGFTGRSQWEGIFAQGGIPVRSGYDLRSREVRSKCRACERAFLHDFRRWNTLRPSWGSKRGFITLVILYKGLLTDS